MSFDDPFSALEPEEEKEKERKKPTPRRASKKDRFERPIDVSRKDVYKATGTGGSVMHGNYYQLTTRIDPDVVEQLREWAVRLNMTQQDLQRYCFYRGLEALEEGERPEFEEVVVKKKLKRPD